MPTYLSLRAVTYFNILLITLLITTACIKTEEAPQLFEEVSLSSGLNRYRGMTHGVAWGDFDRDGLADLYVTNHLNTAQLFHNRGNGHFTDVSSQYFKPEKLEGDKHGAVWADFNNDGALDLVQLTGAGRGVGAEPKHLFINRGTHFDDMASTLGVSNEYGRTRMPLAVDINNDGRLDIFHGAENRFDKRIPPYIFIQQDSGAFIADKNILQIKGKSAPFCIITELTNDRHTELVCRVVGNNRTAQILDTSSQPAKDLDLLPVTAFEDIAAGDFDNDGEIDLFLARKSPSGKIAFGKPASNQLIADISFNNKNLKEQTGFEFESSGEIHFRVKSAFPKNLLSKNSIHIGKNNIHPDTLSFSVSKETAGITESAPYTEGEKAGVFIHYIAPNKWQVLVSSDPLESSPRKNKSQQYSLKLTSTTAISHPVALNQAEKNEFAASRLFMNKQGKLIEESDKRGLNDRLLAATNVVTADFDNDMDLDLFILVSKDIGKQENALFLNDGDGYFTLADNAGYAAGSNSGIGDSVTTVDFDNDGFLDLLTVTGGSMGRSLSIPSEAGAYHLYRNRGNANHWIELDLQGTVSNRDGIGAIVKLTAGGQSQIRIQDNGIHHRSQNHNRIHFGLGKNSMIEKIIIQWPSGKTQELTDVKSNQILNIIES